MQDNIIGVIVGIMFFLNIFLPLLLGIEPIIEELLVIGWIMLIIGMIFVILSIITLRRKGINRIVDSGIYGIVRHPMYIGGMVLFLSHIFFFQHWIIAVNTIVAIFCTYLSIRLGDQRNIEKFGDDYKHYMQKVPRMNFFVGIMRLLQYRNKNE
ncbi:hypothetical protein AC481_04080 [miscellaneous Crenarchaeota group archaeon SMTZ-80]|nr:MAG: hypothetical protein AC481_04080 [miscellaneous Crenarchaeota group archaeon SMTZ-80]